MASIGFLYWYAKGYGVAASLIQSMTADCKTEGRVGAECHSLNSAWPWASLMRVQ